MFLPLSMAPELVPLLDEVLMRAEQWPRSNLGCPQCGRSMHVAHHQGIEIDLCRHCHAVWLDKGEMDKIALQRARQEAKEEAQAEVTAQAPDVFSGVDWGSVDLGGALDWLGEALGGLLSP
jgi:Zn-finger nucleic acid-binding protein